MDVDTIITHNPSALLTPGTGHFTMIGRHTAFLVADCPGQPIAKAWLNNVRRRLRYARWYLDSTCALVRMYRLIRSHYLKTKPQRIDQWDFLSNGALEPALRLYPNQLNTLSRDQLNALPETSLPCGTRSSADVYAEYYFTAKHTGALVTAAKNCGGVICLHNSWTPRRFREMSENDFLSSDCALSALFKHLLFSGQ